ncbi:unnamed protein product [Blepharisma stoltei]|uniref:Uncharacterized protein n=1 Tax=Blepharisma stoltei TaxID=1481888 RepID=A0AAU9INE1_9CILI|nr:unnamed protein product [Blepharisma stoltei]
MEKCDIKGFKKFPLSLILEELEKASRNFQKYSDCLYKVKEIISSKFEQIKVNIQNKNNPEKKRIVDEISSILEFLPKEYEASAKNLISELLKSYREIKKFTRGRIDTLASNQEISDICKMINSLKKDGSNSDYAYAKNKLRMLYI